MSRTSRRQARKRKDRNGAILGGVAVTILVGLFLWGQRTPRAVGPNNCPLDGRYAAQMAILVDPSDTLTTVQVSATPRILDIIEREVPELTEIRVYAVGRAGRRDTAAAIRLCKPTHPDSVSSFTGNPTIVAREYDDDFVVPLRETLSSLLNVESDTISPIMEAIQAAAVNAFQPRAAPIPRHLLIVSDLIQNSADLSFYTDPIDFGPLSRSPDYGTLRVDLSGVSVTAFLLARRGQGGRIQAGGLRRFWEDYFIDQGVEDPSARLRWIPVEG